MVPMVCLAFLCSLQNKAESHNSCIFVEITIEPTNRIRLYVSRIKESIHLKLSDKAIQAAKTSYDQFILKLRAGELENAKLFFSPQIRSQVSQTVFDNMKTAIKPEAF